MDEKNLRLAALESAIRIHTYNATKNNVHVDVESVIEDAELMLQFLNGYLSLSLIGSTDPQLLKVMSEAVDAEMIHDDSLMDCRTATFTCGSNQG